MARSSKPSRSRSAATRAPAQRSSRQPRAGAYKLVRRSKRTTRVQRPAKADTKFPEACGILREVFACGAFLLADCEGLWVYHGDKVPEELMRRVEHWTADIVDVLFAELRGAEVPHPDQE
jgi:hypothetical protein